MTTLKIAGVAASQQTRFHWITVWIACFALLISNGMTLTAITAFDSAILADFPEWTRGQLKFRELITLVLAGLLAPVVGILIDKVGVRILMMIGSVILGIAYFAYGYITDLRQIYMVHAVFAVVLVACGLNVAVILVSTWFVKLRGTAIGIVVVGTSLGGALLGPLYGSWLASGMSWQQGFQLAAFIPASLFLLALFLVRNKPSERGLLPYGVEASPTDSQADISSHGLGYWEALKTRSFWAIAIIAMCTFYTLLGLQANLVLHLQDLGFDIQSASAGLAMLFTPALVGKFLFGMLADKIPGRVILYGNLSVMFLGLIGLLFAGAGTVMVVIFIIGLAWGGFYTLLQLTAINSFGLKASGRLLGTITILDAIGGGLGIYLTGKIFDVYGSYQNAFIIYIVLVAIALLLISQVKKQA
ncbi:MFS transporter [Alkalimonas sp. MEB108]|uniref:MFS transporter n=1 Tax=Alkalimonas cellulosilytica TaxID=3058395 RepID=A0ABU7J8R1_9GAMM|nr:MFS transporter [Alkalimonas sp. MEB108]MEE2002941.1 MFS transporter [Alkalimonas sp. MEB108]